MNLLILTRAAIALSAALIALPAVTADTLPIVSHRLEVEIDPSRGELKASDNIRLPVPAGAIEFSLHRQLQAKLAGPGRLSQLRTQGHLSHYRASFETPTDLLSLHYHGTIRHGLQSLQEGMGRSREQSLGTIGEAGVFLTGFTGWYPRIAETLESFTLSVSLPVGWSAVSQGRGPIEGNAKLGATATTQVEWRESHPQDEIYLIAAPFWFYQQQAGGVALQAWLRNEDPALAERYLTAARTYLARYSALIGDYPYAKFALVENFWETGYGMPSFTLLGPRVLRLPFILHSSFPHEILHNWWGNGVFVDWDSGNWSEGLTAYLADHLNQALEGRGSDYRHDQLKAYADYVRKGDDMALADFRARHSPASQAIGYGKSLMVFHMLRLQLGDAVFIDGLRRLYAEHRFRAASWQDLASAFEHVSGQNLSGFFAAWVQRPGAPQLSLEQVQSQPEADGHYLISGLVGQTQSEALFPLRVPVVLHDIRGDENVLWLNFNEQRQQPFAFRIAQPPLRLAVDPLYDSFRALEPGATPVSLSSLFGAPQGTFILPSKATPKQLQAYQQLADSWQRGQAGWRILQDADMNELPEGAVWLLGWENRFVPAINQAARDFSIDPTHQRIRLLGKTYQDSIPVLTQQFNAASKRAQAVGWLAVNDPLAVSGLARKLPHYGRYGYLIFSGTEPDNQLKGQWSVHDSPLIHWFREPTTTTLAPVNRRSLLEAIPNARPAP